MTSNTALDTLTRFRKSLPDQARIYVAGCSGEPIAIAAAFQQNPTLADGVTFLGIWIPGVNQTDWASISASTQAESIFLSPALRPSFNEGRTRFLPLSYVQSAQWLSSTNLDGGIIMVSSPDQNGLVSLGVSADFSTQILERSSVPLLGLVNHAMPVPHHAPKVRLERFTQTVELEHQLVQVTEAQLPPSFEQIGRHIAGLCEEGDTLQFGLGNVQQAALKALTGHKHMKIHAGMVSNPLVSLLKSGAIDERRGAIRTGVALGTDALYQRVAQDERVVFAPVSETHAISTLSAIPNFKAINSCIEVDLFGQANAEFIGGRQVSGTGGLVDFLRGAAASEGGRAILALSSTAKRGIISRIVPRLPNDATSIARADVETIVTEHGVAHLKHKTIEQRARELIKIADPSFQEQLAADWHEIRKGL